MKKLRSSHLSKSRCVTGRVAPLQCSDSPLSLPPSAPAQTKIQP